MRTQDLITKPLICLQIFISSLSVLDEGSISRKNLTSIYKKVIKFATQVIKALIKSLSDNKALGSHIKMAEAENKLLNSKLSLLTSINSSGVKPPELTQDSSNHSEEAEASPISSVLLTIEAQLAEVKEIIGSIKKSLAIRGTKAKSTPSIEDLLIENARLKAELEISSARVRDLETKKSAPKANSNNSHLPPSKDCGQSTPTKPKKDGSKKRKRGGQPGHKRKIHEKFDKKKVDVLKEYEPENTTCPCCGEEMEPDPENDEQFDQIDIPPVSAKQIAHIGKAYSCPSCQKTKKGTIPQEIKNQGYIGINLAAFIAILKTACSVPLRKIKDNILRDVLGVKVSLGIINKTLKKIALAIRPAYQEVKAHVPNERQLHIDETGHKTGSKKKKLQTWVFDSLKFAFYKIGTRSSFMLEDILGDVFKGTIICDYFSAYGKYAKERAEVKLSYCWAHLKRDAKNCSQYLTASVSKFGDELLSLIHDVFVNNNARSQIADVASMEYQKYTFILRELAEKITTLCKNAPQIGKARGISMRFKRGVSESGYFHFIDNPEIDLTNNAAESAIRFIVTDRKVCFGTRSMIGIIYSQVMWTAWRTLIKHGKSLFSYLVESQETINRGMDIKSLIFTDQTVPPEFKQQAIEATELELSLEKQNQKAEAKLNSEKLSDQNNLKEERIAA